MTSDCMTPDQVHEVVTSVASYKEVAFAVGFGVGFIACILLFVLFTVTRIYIANEARKSANSWYQFPDLISYLGAFECSPIIFIQ